VTGLDNAGKTALLSKFGRHLGIVDLAALKPTQGVDRREIQSRDMDIILWDLGGQDKYRRDYLDSADQYFLDVDLLMYVIDVQDSLRYEDSMEFLDQVIDELKDLKENPYILIFIHKYDPDISTDKEVLLNIELLKELIKAALTDTGLEYEVYMSSIYSMISTEPKFSKAIKDIMTSHSAIAMDPTVNKVKVLEKTAENALNGLVQLSTSVNRVNTTMTDLSEIMNGIDERLKKVEEVIERIVAVAFSEEVEKPQYQPPETHPLPTLNAPPTPVIESGPLESRGTMFTPEAKETMISELSELLAELKTVKEQK